MREGENYSIKKQLEKSRLLLSDDKPKCKVEWTEDGKYWFLKQDVIVG